MKYKVGDMVRVKNDLSCDIYAVVSDMLTHKGKVFTIVEVSVDGHYYKVIENDWAWTDEMLEPAQKDTFKDCFDSAFKTWRKLGDMTSLFHENTVSIKEDRPMAMLTFSTEEGYRIDKTNNTKIPTITTKVVSDIGVTATATCDKEDYDERQGVIEALANYVCRGDFDKQYRKAVKIRKHEDEVKRTCKYCGKTFNTIEEKEAEEDWHIERRKARHERYLLRKRAKEIAFEEAAQKMAKEIAKENK